MEQFETLVEKYMQLDKRTLAELLALKEMYGGAKIKDPQPPQPYVFPSYPWPQSPWTIGDGPYYGPQIWCTTPTRKMEC